MRYIFLCIFCSIPWTVFAVVPVAVEPEHMRTITTIEHPAERQVFYGTLQSFPHTYEIVALEPLQLSVAVRVPDIEAATQNVNGIIIREKEIRGVEEIARMKAVNADWERVHAPFENEWYMQGGTYTGMVDAGVYRIEVSTPTNEEPYALVIGSEEGAIDAGYIERLQHIVAVKRFFGKSAFTALNAPTVYLPPIIFLVLGGVGYLLWRRYQTVA